MVPCPVNNLVEDALRLVKHELVTRKINLVKELADGIPEIRVDRGKIEQVLINILMNAAQAMTSGGILKVRTMHGEIHEKTREEGLREMDLLKSGDEVVIIEVRDHGPGIPEELMTRIFEPFFTTKPTGEGTGLGLSVSKRIIELHRGHLQVKNVDGPRGLRVRVILKAVPGGAAISNPPSSGELRQLSLLEPVTCNSA
jgi:signal transduction histidine kinase